MVCLWVALNLFFLIFQLGTVCPAGTKMRLENQLVIISSLMMMNGIDLSYCNHDDELNYRV